MGRGKKPLRANGAQTLCGAPTHIRDDGRREWWLDGKRHRDDGPAVEHPSRTRWWWRNGELHRDNEPAVEHADGKRYWYRDGQLHRVDGPAVEQPDGKRWWWLHGERVPEPAPPPPPTAPLGPRSRVSALAGRKR